MSTAGFGGVRGWALYGMHRYGTRRYTSRPPANCRSARLAWDAHLKSGPVLWLQLVDGYWGAKRPPSEDDAEGRIDEIENVFALNGET